MRISKCIKIKSVIFVVLMSVVSFLTGCADSPVPSDKQLGLVIPQLQGKSIGKAIQGIFEGGDINDPDGHIILNCKGDQIEIAFNNYLITKGARKGARESHKFKRTYLIEGNKIVIDSFDHKRKVFLWFTGPDDLRVVREDKYRPTMLHRIKESVGPPAKNKEGDMGAASADLPAASFR